MKAVITVIGTDKIGIIASITTILAKAGVNILDISQTILESIFSMIMLVDISNMSMDFPQLVELLQRAGEDLGVEIRLQREEIFTRMHRL